MAEPLTRSSSQTSFIPSISETKLSPPPNLSPDTNNSQPSPSNAQELSSSTLLHSVHTALVSHPTLGPSSFDHGDSNLGNEPSKNTPPQHTSTRSAQTQSRRSSARRSNLTEAQMIKLVHCYIAARVDLAKHDEKGAVEADFARAARAEGITGTDKSLLVEVNAILDYYRSENLKTVAVKAIKAALGHREIDDSLLWQLCDRAWSIRDIYSTKSDEEKERARKKMIEDELAGECIRNASLQTAIARGIIKPKASPVRQITSAGAVDPLTNAGSVEDPCAVTAAHLANVGSVDVVNSGGSSTNAGYNGGPIKANTTVSVEQLTDAGSIDCLTDADSDGLKNAEYDDQHSSAKAPTKASFIDALTNVDTNGSLTNSAPENTLTSTSSLGTLMDKGTTSHLTNAVSINPPTNTSSVSQLTNARSVEHLTNAGCNNTSGNTQAKTSSVDRHSGADSVDAKTNAGSVDTNRENDHSRRALGKTRGLKRKAPSQATDLADSDSDFNPSEDPLLALLQVERRETKRLRKELNQTFKQLNEAMKANTATHEDDLVTLVPPMHGAQPQVQTTAPPQIKTPFDWHSTIPFLMDIAASIRVHICFSRAMFLAAEPTTNSRVGTTNPRSVSGNCYAADAVSQYRVDN
ncbi:uncharacterized protein FOMMEDRAFT_170166 [Fomitiporia mediterranea MF3/22]|uniref:uncharacterized protein n=1 Tax=Fomitiporia mediterranea (strain MF3/22) TaxID=694068 RepID=UPI0004409C93|nr:uncharacterized protein FOMMEDRAFT_170166 [Fomitiporia mediterranea MF3/22]EJD00161.1 hypothetical protein FOMMEDRAFT_170166 [Fomitiporia mediterranea MF3/22]